MSASPNLQLPYLDANQNQKSVTHNQALRMLDALVNLGVEASGLKAPPAAPADGQRWIVAPGATGAWAGRDLNLAAWQDGAWSFFAPGRGTLAYDAAGAMLLFWTGAAWRPIASLLALLGVTALGIGTAPDTGNPLSATLNNALFNALAPGAGGTGDVRVKLNKAAAGNTASFLFQDGFSGRAEIGLSGDDNFHFKVSPDGTTFVDAMVVAAANGAVAFAASPTAPTPAPGDSGQHLATTGFVTAAVTALVAAAPGALDTLKELADALGDDPNFAATVTTMLGGKAPLLSPALAGAPTAPTPALNDTSTRLATTAFVAGAVDPLAISPVTPSLDYRLTASDCLPPGQFSRLSTGCRTTAAGLLVPVAAGGLRIDHDPVTGAPLGALIEEQRTNLLLFTTDIGAGAWQCGVNASFQGTTTAPDGSGTARIVRMSSTGNAYAVQTANMTAGTTYTLSGWFKLVAGTPSGGGVLEATWSGGFTQAQASPSSLSAVWQRFSVTFAPTSSGSYGIYALHDMAPTGTVDMAVWGLQLEAGAFATSYIPTAGAQATRAADSLVVPVDGTVYNPLEGTFFFEGVCPPVGPGAQPFFEAFDRIKTADNRMMLRRDDGSHYQAWCGINGNGYVGVTLAAATPGEKLRAAMSYTTATLAGSVNGLPAVSGAITGTIPMGIQTFRIGCSVYDGCLGSTAKRFAYIPRALSAAQLQAMTA